MHTPDISDLTRINLAGDGPVFGSPCGCHISETRPPFWELPQTQHITNHRRSGLRASHTAPANVWPGTFLIRNWRLAWNATRCRVLLSTVLRTVWGVVVYFGPWQLVSANFQINTREFRIGNCCEWIAFSLALPQTRDNRRSTRTGDIAGKVVESVSISNESLFSWLLYLYEKLAA